MTMYAMYYHVRYQDGSEDGWVLFKTKEEIEKYLTQLANRGLPDEENTTRKIYEVELVRELTVENNPTLNRGIKVILTNEERQKFIKYLQDCASSDKSIVEQMKAIKVPAALHRMHEARIVAYNLVIDDLSRIETEVISK